MKVCTKCGATKSPEQFYRSRQSRSGFSSWCKDCEKAVSAARYARNREKVKRRVKAWRKENPDRRRPELLKKYGITQIDYDAMHTIQKGLCKICGKPPEDAGYLSVDHDHRTGKVRGLLCRKCNRGLGHFYDNPALLQAAIGYLQQEGSSQ